MTLVAKSVKQKNPNRKIFVMICPVVTDIVFLCHRYCFYVVTDIVFLLSHILFLHWNGWKNSCVFCWYAGQAAGSAWATVLDIHGDHTLGLLDNHVVTFLLHYTIYHCWVIKKPHNQDHTSCVLQAQLQPPPPLMITSTRQPPASDGEVPWFFRRRKQQMQILWSLWTFALIFSLRVSWVYTHTRTHPVPPS